MKAGKVIQEVEDDDIITIPKGCGEFVLRCCDCGLWHHVKIERHENDDIDMNFKRLDEEPELEDPTFCEIRKEM